MKKRRVEIEGIVKEIQEECVGGGGREKGVKEENGV